LRFGVFFVRQYLLMSLVENRQQGNVQVPPKTLFDVGAVVVCAFIFGLVSV
jgi:hypothetical protein